VGIRRLAGLLLAGLMLAACGREEPGSPVAAPGPPPQPALWRVSDADTMIYLFGTIHMLPPDLAWRSPAVDAALAEARVVMFEADVEGDAGDQAALVERLGRLTPPEQLSDFLDRDEAAEVIAAGGRYGLSPTVLASLRPWFAAVMLADAAIRRGGFSGDVGADTVLRADAARTGKELRFLETMERQLGALAGLSDETQVAYLMFTVGDLGGAEGDLAAAVGAWVAGEAGVLERVLIDEDMARLPALREALLTRRNAEWAAELKRILDGETGVFFVAVGAAHLVGEDSVQRQLAALGPAAERVQ